MGFDVPGRNLATDVRKGGIMKIRYQSFTGGMVMAKRKFHKNQTDSSIREMKEHLQDIAKSSEKLEDIRSSTEELVKNSGKKLPLVISIIAMAATVIATIVAVMAYGKPASKDIENEAAAGTEKPAYELYLCPEYGKLKVGAQTKITAKLNFNASAVTLDGYLNSVKNGDTVEMNQKDSGEWQATVNFEEPGIFKVVATATAPDGTKVEGSVKIDVIGN